MEFIERLGAGWDEREKHANTFLCEYLVGRRLYLIDGD